MPENEKKQEATGSGPTPSQGESSEKPESIPNPTPATNYIELDVSQATVDDIAEELSDIQQEIRLIGDTGKTAPTKARVLRPFLHRLENLLTAKDIPDDLSREIKRAHHRANNMLNSLESLGIGEDEASPSSSGNTFHCRKVRMKSFKGDYRKWKEWWAAYETAVHKNPAFPTKAAKMFQLLEYVDDQAYKTLPSKIASDTAYDECIKALKDRFGNPAHLANVYYQDLDSIQPADKSAKNLRAVIDQVKDLVSKLQSCNDHYDPHKIMNAVFKLFPRSMILTIINDSFVSDPGADIELSKFLAKLNTRVEAVEYYHARLATDGVVSEDSLRVTLAVQKRSSEDRDGANDRNTAKRAKKTSLCSFCDKGHKSSECNQYTSVEARLSRLRSLKRCTRCTGATHTESTCRHRNIVCIECKKSGHVRPICPDYSNRTSTDTKGTFLETFTCKICLGNGNCIVVRGVLDRGSDTSYILESTVLEAGADLGVQSSLRIQAFGSSGHSSSSQVEVTFFSANDERQETTTLHTIPRLVDDARLAPPVEVASQVFDQLPSNCHYADPDLLVANARKIEVLIGQDYYYRFVRKGRVRQLSKDSVLLPSYFGWIPAGSFNLGNTDSSKKVTLFSSSGMCNASLDDTSAQGARVPVVPSLGVPGNDPNDSNPAPDLTKLWDLETLGIKAHEQDPTPDTIMEYFRKTSYFKDGRYWVCWPFKKEPSVLQSNYRPVLARTRNMFTRTDRDLLVRCDEYLKELLHKGHIEIVPGKPKTSPCPEIKAPAVHYLPVRPVEHNGKIRPVFDASFHGKSAPSLNQIMHQGPSLVANLATILLNFCLQPVGVSSDIEKAFLQLMLNLEHRDVTRFLWVQDIDREFNERTNIVYYRLTCVFFGATASPYLLNMTVQEHLSNQVQDQHIERAKRSMYVDNMVTSVKSVSEACSMQKRLTEAFAKGGFNLRDWISNSQVFNNTVPSELKMKESNPISILGLDWTPVEDMLSYRFELSPIPDAGTLRSVLSILSSVYDPLGWVYPCMVEYRLFIQDCWKAKLKWDQMLPQDLAARFRKLVSQRNEIKKVRKPRYLWMSDTDPQDTYELHTFCDASKKAYGSASYIVRHPPPQSWKPSESALIMAKTRIAPVTTAKTIPRLELMGAQVGVRQSEFLKSCIDLKFEGRYLWTDATSIIQWLHSPKIQPPFFQNRLDEIRKSTGLVVQHVPGTENPADIASRGLTAEKLIASEVWWKGPTWLTSKPNWPTPPDTAEAVSLTVSKVQVEPWGILDDLRFGSSGKYTLEELYNDWEKYIRLFSFVARIVAIAKGKPQASVSELRYTGEHTIIRELQKKYLPTDLGQIKHCVAVGLYRHEDGLVRCFSRMQGSQFDLDMASPMYLPRDHRFTRLIIQSIHRKGFHCNVNTTLAGFRQQYWTPGARTLVNSIIRQCIVCRKFKGKAFVMPPMAPLPSIRTSPIIPFVNVGVDLFGPLYITAGEETGKVYCCIFACLVTRAIHLELVRDMSGDEFLLELQKFISYRGKPNLVLSDNATNFTFVQPLVGNKVKLTDRSVTDYVHQHAIDWCFIPAYSPWYGGAYERLIGIVKTTVRNALYPKLTEPRMIDWVTLDTVLKVAADIVNSRPLTHIPNSEPLEVITPNSLLKLGRPSKTPPFVVNDHRLQSTGQKLVQGFRHVSQIVEVIQDKFAREYFTHLRDMQARYHKTVYGSVKRRPKKGEVVLIYDPLHERSQWQAGIVEVVHERELEVVTVNRHSNLNKPLNLLTKKRVIRPYKHFYPLELFTGEFNEVLQRPLQKTPQPSTSTSQIRSGDVDVCSDARSPIPKSAADDSADSDMEIES